MFALLSFIVVTALVAFLLAYGIARGVTVYSIAGAYNRDRLLPSEMYVRVRSRRTIFTWGCVLLVVLLVGAAAFLHNINIDNIPAQSFFGTLVNQPVIDARAWLDDDEFSPALVYIAAYSLWLILLVLASVFGARRGIRAGCDRFFLTHQFPRIKLNPA